MLFRSKGKSFKTLNGATLSLKIKFTKSRATGLSKFNGGPVSFTAKYKGIFSDDWMDEGVHNATVPKNTPMSPMLIDVLFSFNNTTYSMTLVPKQTSTINRGGKFANSR